MKSNLRNRAILAQGNTKNSPQGEYLEKVKYMGTLSSLPNVGKVLENNLKAIGVHTPEQLVQMGSKEAFLRIRLEVDDQACLHMLYGIEGAIENIRDTGLSENTKKDLKEFYNSL